jgi:nitrate reductase gamma subunit
MLQAFIYLSVVVFVIVSGVRIYRYLSAPIHLRWELYPVAHEKGKGYGGSYFEEHEWWTKTREKTWIGEIMYMIPEILLIRGLWKNNRSLWYISYPFHAGLYLLVAVLGLLVLGGIFEALGVPVSSESGNIIVLAIYYITILLAFVGLVAGLIGCVALFLRRLISEELRNYASFADYFNLIFLFAVMGAALLTWLFVDHNFIIARQFIKDLITFQAANSGSGLFNLQIFLLGLLLIYMPFTHMIHFFAKYFMYHHVKWDDEPNIRGGSIEKKVNAVLQKPVSWSAPHIKGDGKKTWVDTATEEVE